MVSDCSSRLGLCRTANFRMGSFLARHIVSMHLCVQRKFELAFAPSCEISHRFVLEPWYSCYPKDPTLDVRHGALSRFKRRVEKTRQRTIHVRTPQPGRSGIGGLLVRVASVFIGKTAGPEGWIHLCDSRTAGRNFPAVERPEMQVVPTVLTKEAQPRQAGVCGLCHRTLHVKKKYGLRRGGPELRQSQPCWITRTFTPIATFSMAYEIDVSVVFVRRPMALEIVEKLRPIRWQAMGFKIPHRKRKAVVNPDNRWSGFGQFAPQPLGDPSSRPIRARTGRRRNFLRCDQPVAGIHAQSRQARCRRFRARVINADVMLEFRHGSGSLLWERRCASALLLVLPPGPLPRRADASANGSSLSLP